jgi:hypothetical protein
MMSTDFTRLNLGTVWVRSTTKKVRKFKNRQCRCSPDVAGVPIRDRTLPPFLPQTAVFQCKFESCAVAFFHCARGPGTPNTTGNITTEFGSVSQGARVGGPGQKKKLLILNRGSLGPLGGYDGP